jgi:hypothetical protein
MNKKYNNTTYFFIFQNVLSIVRHKPLGKLSDFLPVIACLRDLERIGIMVISRGMCHSS